MPLKRSPEYRAIRPRVAELKPDDAWQEEGLHFFAFELRPEEGAAVVKDEPPMAVFAMHPEETNPISAVVITPSLNGKEAEVLDLRRPDSAYTAPYRSEEAETSDTIEITPLPKNIAISTTTPTAADVDELRRELKIDTDLSAPAGTEDMFQWQRRDGQGDWVNIEGETATSLTLTGNAIAALMGEPLLSEVTVNSLTCTARLYQIEVRLHVTRTHNIGLPSERSTGRDSSALKVALLNAVAS